MWLAIGKRRVNLAALTDIKVERIMGTQNVEVVGRSIGTGNRVVIVSDVTTNVADDVLGWCDHAIMVGKGLVIGATEKVGDHNGR